MIAMTKSKSLYSLHCSVRTDGYWINNNISDYGFLSAYLRDLMFYEYDYQGNVASARVLIHSPRILIYNL